MLAQVERQIAKEEAADGDVLDSESRKAQP